MATSIIQADIDKFYETCEDFHDFVDRTAKSQGKTVDVVLKEALTREIYSYYLDDGR